MSVNLTFPDSTYTDANKPNAVTLQSDLSLIEADLNSIQANSTQTLTNKSIDADNNTITNLAHGSEVDEPSSGTHGVTGTIVGTTDTQTLTNKTLNSDTNVIAPIHSYMARAYSASDQTITENVLTQVTLGTESFDPNTNFASSKYTAPVDGYYQVNAQVRLSAANYLYSTTLSLFRDTTAIATNYDYYFRSGIEAIQSIATPNISEIVSLTAGQTLSIKATGDDSDSGAITAKAGSQYTFLSVSLISRN